MDAEVQTEEGHAVRGYAFRNLVELAEQEFGLETADRMIEESHTAAAGAYTTVGRYPAAELVQLLDTLSQITGVPATELGDKLGRRLVRPLRMNMDTRGKQPPPQDCIAFLTRYAGYMNSEYAQHYPDRPNMGLKWHSEESGRIVFEYRSPCRLAYLIGGIIKGAIDDFGENISVERVEVDDCPAANGCNYVLRTG